MLETLNQSVESTRSVTMLQSFAAMDIDATIPAETVSSNDSEEKRLLVETRNLIKNGGKAISKAENENIVLILGSTGCGKSTSINYLAGCQMVEVEDKDTGMKSIACLDPIADIGDGSISKTLYPQIIDFKCPLENYNFKFLDTAGFSDNRGAAHDICASFCLGQVFEKSAAILGVIVLIQEADITTSRIPQVVALFKQLNMCLNRESFSGCITFFISKNFTNKTPKNLYHLLLKSYNELKNSHENIAWLFEEFLAEESQNIHICNPLADNERQSLLDAISSLKTIVDKNRAFNYPLSEDTRLVITNLVTTLKQEIQEKLNHTIVAFDAHIASEIATLKTLNSLDEKIQWLEDYDKAAVSCSGGSISRFISVLGGFGLSGETMGQSKGLYNDLIEALRQAEDLTHFNSGSSGDIALSQSAIELVQVQVERHKKSIDGIISKILGSMLEDRLMAYDVQRIVCEKTVREKFLPLSLNDGYVYKLEDFAVLNVVREELDVLVQRLAALGESGNHQIKSAINRCLLNPFTIPQSADTNKALIIRANVKNMAMSAVRTALQASIANLTYTSIWLVAKDTIYMDADLGMDFASGKNVVVACKELVVSNNAKINTSGNTPDINTPPLNALYGHNGGNAGNIHLLITGDIHDMPLTLVANGGNGSRGANGSKGITGSKGDDGTDASYKRYFAGKMFSGELRFGTEGKLGGDGGPGTDAGSGGLGGKAGTILVYAPKDYGNMVKAFTEAGVNGPNGIAGMGGDGGLGGYNGYNTLSFSPSGIDKTAYFTGYFTDWDYKVTGIMEYTITLENGSWTKGDNTGPARTYARRGNPGACGTVKQTPYALSDSLSTIAENTIHNIYHSCTAN